MQQDRWKSLVEEVGPSFAEGAAHRDSEDTFVADHYPVLRESGVLAMMVPEALGGGGATHRTTCDALRALAWHDGATALALSMHQHLVAALCFKHRRGDERATATLRRVAADGLVLVSTGARDWLESNGELVRVDGGYRLTARKAFASGCPAGDVAVTSAPYDDPEQGPRVLHFAVPLHAEGVSIGDDWAAHGMRATGSHTMSFDGVFVPDHAITLSRAHGELHPVWHVVLTVALPLISSVYVGIADRALEVARGLARKRAGDPAVQWSMGEGDSSRIVAGATLDAMKALTNDLDFEPSLDRANRMLALKTATVGAAQRSVEACFEAAGGAAFYRKHGLERLLRDVRAGDFHPMRRTAQTLLTGRVALGLEPVAG